MIARLFSSAMSDGLCPFPFGHVSLNHLESLFALCQANLVKNDPAVLGAETIHEAIYPHFILAVGCLGIARKQLIFLKQFDVNQASTGQQARSILTQLSVESVMEGQNVTGPHIPAPSLKSANQ